MTKFLEQNKNKEGERERERIKLIRCIIAKTTSSH